MDFLQLSIRCSEETRAEERTQELKKSQQYRFKLSASELKVIALAVVLVFADLLAGPYVQFPVFFVIPVMLAAWSSGPTFALGMAMCLAFARFLCHWLWDFPMDLMPAVVNNLMRVTVLGILAYATAKTAQLIRSMRERIALLERQLPICPGCGLIRDKEGQWVLLESLPVVKEQKPRCTACEERLERS